MKTLLTRSSKLLRCSFPSQSKRRGISWGPDEKKGGRGGQMMKEKPPLPINWTQPVSQPQHFSVFISLGLIAIGSELDEYMGGEGGPRKRKS